MKTVAETMKSSENKKRALEDQVDALNEELAAARAQGKKVALEDQVDALIEELAAARAQGKKRALENYGCVWEW